MNANDTTPTRALVQALRRTFDERMVFAVESLASTSKQNADSVAELVRVVARFVEIATRPTPVQENVPAKTSLVLSLADRPGARGEVLMRFAARNLSLTKLESRPIPEAPFTYRFYVDVMGHAASVPFAGALEDIRPLTTELRVLGTYPAATV
jgi:prephenate dehydratase